MKSLTLDSIYQKIDRHINLAAAHTEKNYLPFLIKACRLKPYSYICEKRVNKLILYKWWFDEFGNSLKIDNKQLSIVPNDLSLNKDCIISTDLYYGLSLNKIMKMSNLVHITAGTDEDKLCYTLSFIGIDNYIRCYYYFDGHWEQIAPLLLGPAILQNIYENIDLKYFLEFENKENNFLPYAIKKQWLSYLPVHEHLTQLLNREHEEIAFLFNNQKE